MCLSEKFQLSRYIPARITEGKVWFISFYVFNPGINKLERIRIKINRITNIRLKRQLGQQMVIDINSKLASGWNPIIEAEASKSYHKLIDVMNTFIATKEKELRPDSMRTYRSYISILKNYILKNIKNKDIYVISASKKTLF